MTTALVVAVVVSGAMILPKAAASVGILQAADDPGRLAELRLPTVATEQRITFEIDDALSKGDGDLARSFLDLADAHGLKVDAERRERVTSSAASREVHAGQESLGGVTSGASDTWLGTAAALTADVVGITDVRDLWQEGGKLVQGEPYDRVILGLSTAGLALTGFTVASLLPSGGGSIAARVPVARGLGLLKAARRAGLLSRELAGKVARLATSALDTVALEKRSRLRAPSIFRRLDRLLRGRFVQARFARSPRWVMMWSRSKPASASVALLRPLVSCGMPENSDEPGVWQRPWAAGLVPHSSCSDRLLWFSGKRSACCFKLSGWQSAGW